MNYITKIMNGQEVPLTAEEIAALGARDAEVEAGALDRAYDAIDKKYERKLAFLQDLAGKAFIADGENMETNLSNLRTRWQEVVAERTSEINALFEEL